MKIIFDSKPHGVAAEKKFLQSVPRCQKSFEITLNFEITKVFLSLLVSVSIFSSQTNTQTDTQLNIN